MASIIMCRPHVHQHADHWEFCVDYRFTEPVAGVVDGMVGMDPVPGMTDADILAALIPLVVDHANLQTADAQPFTADDVITWECHA
jgi:hypothetical protein